jgi:thiol peroxidase
VRLNEPTGRVRIISIVPTLETLFSESQTRHISEALPTLSGAVERVTVSANSAEEQEGFAKRTTIRNMIFLSDAPHFAFGTATGLWVAKEYRLQRAVIVTNRESVIQYFEVLSTPQFPNYDRLYQVVRRLVAKP